jgi:hypothetical protein
MQKSTVELLTMLQQAYVDTVMKTSQMYDWHKHFHDRRDSVDADSVKSVHQSQKQSKCQLFGRDCENLSEGNL